MLVMSIMDIVFIHYTDDDTNLVTAHTSFLLMSLLLQPPKRILSLLNKLLGPAKLLRALHSSSLP